MVQEMVRECSVNVAWRGCSHVYKTGILREQLTLYFCSVADNVHFQHTAQLVQALTNEEILFRLQVCIIEWKGTYIHILVLLT